MLQISAKYFFSYIYIYFTLIYVCLSLYPSNCNVKLPFVYDFYSHGIIYFHWENVIKDSCYMCCLLSLYLVWLGNNECQMYFLYFTEMLTNMILVYTTLTLPLYTCHVEKLETAREIYFEKQTHNRPYDFSTTLLYRFSIGTTDDIVSNLYRVLQTNRNASIG